MFFLQVSKIPGHSEQSTSCVQPVSPFRPTTRVGFRQSLRHCSRPTSTCKPKDHFQSRLQETSNKPPSQHRNHQLSHNQHLSPHHKTACEHYSNTFSSLQNSGQKSSRIPTKIPYSNVSVTTHLGESHEVLRFSRRRRGLPPENCPTHLNQPLNNHSLKNCRTLQYKNVPLLSNCHFGDAAQTGCDTAARQEHVVRMDNSTAIYGDTCGNVGGVSLEKEELLDEIMSLANITALEPSEEERVTFTRAIITHDVAPVGKVICRKMREKQLQRNKPINGGPVLRTVESRSASRGATARTTSSKNKLNSAALTDSPSRYFARCSAKDTNKTTSKDINKGTSITSGYTMSITSQDTKKDFFNCVTKDHVPVSTYSRTCKGSTKGLTQTKYTTLALKTRTSPRILLKR